MFHILPCSCFTFFLVHVSLSSLSMFYFLPCSCFTLFHVLLSSLFMFYFLPYPCFSFFLVHVLFSSLFMFPRMHVLSCTSFQFSSKDGGSPIAAWRPRGSMEFATLGQKALGNFATAFSKFDAKQSREKNNVVINVSSMLRLIKF